MFTSKTFSIMPPIQVSTGYDFLINSYLGLVAYGPLTPEQAKIALKEAYRQKAILNYVAPASAFKKLPQDHWDLDFELELQEDEDEDEEVIELGVDAQEVGIKAADPVPANVMSHRKENLAPSVLLSDDAKKCVGQGGCKEEPKGDIAPSNLEKGSELQASVIQQALEICQKRIQSCELFLQNIKQKSYLDNKALAQNLSKEFNFVFEKGQEQLALTIIHEFLPGYIQLYKDYIDLLRNNFQKEHVFDILDWKIRRENMEQVKHGNSLQKIKLLKLFKPYLSASYQEFLNVRGTGIQQDTNQAVLLKNLAYGCKPLELLEAMKREIKNRKLENEELHIAEKLIEKKSAQLQYLIKKTNRLLNQTYVQSPTPEEALNNFNGYYIIKKEIEAFNRVELERLTQLSEINAKQKQLEVLKANLEKKDTAAAKKDAKLDAEYEALLAYKQQKQEELRAYKAQVKQEQVLRKARLSERTRILSKSLNFGDKDEKEAAELTATEAEHLQNLVDNLNKGQCLTLAKVFKCEDLVDVEFSRKDRPKFSEIEGLIKALGGKILEDGHFGFLVPNIKKEWGEKIEDPNGSSCYMLTRQSMSRYVSCHPHGKQHNSDELSPLAVDCVKRGLEKAGISPDNIKQLKKAKKVVGRSKI